MKNVKLNIFFTFLVLSLTNCNSSGEGEICDKGLLVTYLLNDKIPDDFATLKDDISALDLSVSELVANPSIAQVEDARVKFKTAGLSNQLVSWVTFDPPTSNYNDFGYNRSFATWPINVELIETNILDENTDISLVVMSVKGLYAIEYLLFENEDAAIQLSILDDNRLSYLSGVSHDLKSQVTQINDQWNALNVVNASMETQVNESLTVLTSALVSDLDKLQRLKLAQGLRAEAIPELSSMYDEGESPYAGLALEYMKVQMNNLFSLYYGDIDAKNGWESLLDCSENGMALQTRINDNIDKIISLFDGLPTDKTFEEMIASEDPNIVVLSEKLRELVILFKTDLFSQLGLRIIFTEVEDD